MSQLEKATAKLDKKFGDGTVRLFVEVEYPEVETISTGSLKLDRAIGGQKKILGIPRGRVSILWGPKGAGKSTVSYHIINNAQRLGLKAALVDWEFSFDPAYAQACGVDIETLLFVRTYKEETGAMFSAEDGWEIIETLVNTGEVGLVVVDSIDAMVPRAELDGEYGESHPGLKARINGQAMRKLLGALRIHETALVAITQHHYKVMQRFGDPRTMSGGESLKHAASLRVDMTPTKQEKDRGEAIARLSRCYVKWNKIAPPSGVAEITIRYGEGISLETELLDMACELGVINKRGAYYYFTEDEYIQGKANAVQHLKDNPDLSMGLREQITATM